MTSCSGDETLTLYVSAGVRKTGSMSRLQYLPQILDSFGVRQ